MINLILNRKVPGKIDIVELDATLRENEEYVNTVTEFPVEAGFAINDHIIHQPEKVTIEGFITNTPVPNSVTAAPLLTIGAGNRVTGAMEKLLELAGYDSSGVNGAGVKESIKPPKIIDIEMGLRVYHDMVIERLTIPRDNKTGETLSFTIEAKRIVIVQTEFALISNSSELNGKAKNAKKQTKSTAEKGVQQAKQATTDNKTLALKALQFVGQLTGSSF